MITNSVTSIEDFGGGKFRNVVSVKPDYYQSNGIWKPITNTLGNSGDPNLTIGVKELFDVRIRNKLSGQAPVIFLGKGNNQLKYRPLGTNNSNAIVSGNVVTFPEAWNNADLKLTIAGHIFQKDILLKTGHPTSFSFRIDDKTNLDDDLVGSEFYIARPYLYKDGESPVYLEWVKSFVGGKLILTVNLPNIGDWNGWTLDPTYTSQPDGTSGFDTFINDASPNLNYHPNVYLYHNWFDDGYEANRRNTLIKFDLSSIPSGSTVNTATLFLRGYGSTTNSATIFRSKRAWVETQATWNIYSTGNNWGTAGSLNSTTDYDNNSLASFTLASGTNNLSLSTTLVQEMLPGGSFTNNGFFIRNDALSGSITEGIASSSDATTASFRPKLTIEYTEAGTVKPAYYYAQQ